jgi:hypothetical protein
LFWECSGAERSMRMRDFPRRGLALPTSAGEKKAMKGRGTEAAPPNRYERMHVELEPDDDNPPAERVAMHYYRDASRTILAENKSPDIPFRWSLNPYRGCEHGCTYCLGGDTLILHADMTWRPIGEVQVGDVLLGFDEHTFPGTTRKLRQAVVEAVWWSRRPTTRLITEHADVTTTADHRWLQWRGFRWSRTTQLFPGRALRSIDVTPAEPDDDDYRCGYIAGLSLGDGTFRYHPSWRSDKLGYPASYWRVAMADEEPLRRIVSYLQQLAIESHIRPFDGGRSARRVIRKVEVRSLARLAVVRQLIMGERDSRSYRRGFLAGFFDAEGSNGDNLRLSQVDLGVLARVQRYAESLGFNLKLEPRPGHASNLRLAGASSIASGSSPFADPRSPARCTRCSDGK